MAQRKSARTTSPNRTKTAKAPSRSAKTIARAAAPAKKGAKTRTVRNAGSASVDVPVGEREITIDRRRGDAPQSVSETSPPAHQLERRKKVNRRRQIDPTTCERDYTDQEVEFMNAIDEYKRTSGRMFPTCSEVLEVLRNLGYVKVAAPLAAMAEAVAKQPVGQSFESQDADEEALSFESN
jgi:hypothetical protein